MTLWWEETGGAGRGSAGRPVLEAVRTAARTGDLRRLYVYRLDRLTRSGIADTLGLLGELRRYGCEVISVADGWDTTGAGAELLAAFLGWVAQIERDAIVERVAAARTRIEANGGAWGRPKRLTRERVAWVRRELAAGKSLRALAKQLEVGRSSITRALRRWPENPPRNRYSDPPKKPVERELQGVARKVYFRSTPTGSFDP